MAELLPLVSVVVSSYNRPRLIRDALDSVLAQTWLNWELIVADDHSSADTVRAIRLLTDRVQAVKGAYGARFLQPPTVPTPHERQFGQRCAVCINAAIVFARGEFVAFLPDDDFLTPRSLEVRARYLMAHPEVNVVYGRLESCVSPEPVLGIHWMGEDFTRGLEYVSGTFPSCQHDRNGFWSATPIARAANKVDHGMFMARRVPYACDGKSSLALSNPQLPEWPEHRTFGWQCGDGELAESYAADDSPDDATLTDTMDCPDAGFLFRCELAGLGPFHSVPEVVVVKRYHSRGHRTDPTRRE